MYPYRVFTLEQANRTLPEVADLTRSAQERLEVLRLAYREAGDDKGTDLEEEMYAALSEWAQAVLQLGAQPKGIFTVDFFSPDPNVLWCWQPDEENISHRHFTWESFKDRVALEVVGVSSLSLN